MESSSSYEKYPFLKELGLDKENCGVYADGKWFGSGKTVASVNPGDGTNIAFVKEATVDDYKVALKNMLNCEKQWKNTPMPKRGEVVR